MLALFYICIAHIGGNDCSSEDLLGSNADFRENFEAAVSEPIDPENLEAVFPGIFPNDRLLENDSESILERLGRAFELKASVNGTEEGARMPGAGQSEAPSTGRKDE